MTLTHLVELLLWIIHIVEGIPDQIIRRPVKIYVDNKPAINLVNNHVASKFTRHIGITHHSLRDHCENGDGTFKIIWVNIKRQQSNDMTKPLPRSEFKPFQYSVVSDIRL